MSAIKGVQFGWPDYVVLCLVPAITLGIGLYHSVRSKTSSKEEYLLAGRSLWALPVGLSILATFLSAVLYIGLPAEIYQHGITYTWTNVAKMFSVIFIAVVLVPLLYPLKLTSAYEYLERRYQSKTARAVGSLLGALNMLLNTGLAIFLPSITLETVSGIPTWVGVVVIAGIGTLFTALGGMRAVVWTDVFLCFMMLAGLLAIIIQGILNGGGIEHIWEVQIKTDRLDWPSLSVDPRVRHTWWSLLIGGSFVWLAGTAVSQNTVQRINSVPSMRAAKGAVMISAIGFLILTCLGSFVGLITYSYFYDIKCDPISSKVIRNPNQLVPLYVMEAFGTTPAFPGFFVASLFAASLSTMSSQISGLSAMMWEDALKWRFGHLKERKVAWILKGLVVLAGLLTTALTFLVQHLGGPGTQIASIVYGSTGGPCLGMFLLGAFFPCANWIGASLGSVLACAMTLWITLGSTTMPPSPRKLPAPITNCSSPIISAIITNMNVTNIAATPADRSGLEELYSISYLWFATIGVVSSVIFGLIISLLTYKCAGHKPSTLEPELFIPACENVCCCLPRGTQRCLRCGVPPETSEDDDMILDESASKPGMMSHRNPAFTGRV